MSLLHGQRQLLRDHRRLRFQPDGTTVSQVVLLCEPADLLAQRLRLLRAEVGAAPVEPLVALELLGPVQREVLEEVLPRSGLQEEQVRPDPAGTGLAGRANDLGELLDPIADPRQNSG